VLGLRDGEAVAGNHDHLIGVGHLDGGVGGRGGLDGALVAAGRSAAGVRAAEEPNTIAGMERFIATAIRLVRIEPEAPTIMPATIIAVLFSADPLRRRTTRSSR
jgi:hypothetical protein